MAGIFNSSIFNNAIFNTGTPSVVVVDTHDGHTDAERKRNEDRILSMEALRKQIEESFEIVTGEARIPMIEELPKFEKKAGSLPKAERPAYRKDFVQIRNWLHELNVLSRQIQSNDDDEAIMVLM